MEGNKLMEQISRLWKRKNSGFGAEKDFEPLSDSHAAYLKELVKKAGKADAGCEVFGSEKHKYMLNPVADMEKVRQFEKRYHLVLPEEYVFFLTKVGNGGAGPYYGIYSLEVMEKFTEYLKSYTEEDKAGLPVLLADDLTPESWAEMMAQEEEDDDEAYDALMKRVCSGLVVIGTQGCSYDNLLMWKGSEQGKIVYIDWNLDPEYGPFFTGMTFLAWYESFFLEILADHKLSSYGYRSLKSEKELREEYVTAGLEKEKIRILSGFFKFKKAEPETVKFLTDLDNLDLDGERMRAELLFEMDPDKGIQVFEDLLDGRNPQGAVSCCRRLPRQYKDQYYEKMAALLYCSGIQDKSRLLYFLHDCGCRRAADIAPFAMDASNFEEDRKAAIYVMGSCEDMAEYCEFFKKMMKDDSYWLAHTALQAAAVTHIHAFLDTYEWMWEKYKNDSTMCSNLKIAFKNLGMNREG